MKISIDRKRYNFNKNIKSKLIKLISTRSSSLGFYKLIDVLNISKKLKVDLLELTIVNKLYSICKLIKSGKFEYFESKRVKKPWKLNKKKLKNFKLVEKEMGFHLLIYANDYESKMKKIIKFLCSGFNVKINILIKGRAATKTCLINDLILGLIYDLKNYGNLEHSPSFINGKIEDNPFLYLSGKKKYYD